MPDISLSHIKERGRENPKQSLNNPQSKDIPSKFTPFLSFPWRQRASYSTNVYFPTFNRICPSSYHCWSPNCQANQVFFCSFSLLEISKKLNTIALSPLDISFCWFPPVSLFCSFSLFLCVAINNSHYLRVGFSIYKMEIMLSILRDSGEKLLSRFM